MRILYVLGYSIFALLSLVLTLRSWRRRFTLTAFALFVYITTCSFGLIYLSYWRPYLPYLGGYSDSPIMYNDLVFFRQLVSQFLVLAIGMIFLIPYTHKRPGIVTHTFISRHRLALVSFVLLGIGLFFYVRYFVFGPGLDLLLSTRLSFSSTQEAVASRTLAKPEIGQGAYGSFIASAVFFPTVAFVWSYYRMPLRSVLFFLLALCSLAYSIQTRQKAPVLLTLLQYLSVFWFSFSNIDERKLLVYFKRLLLIGVIIIVFAYVVNFGQDWIDALVSAWSRLFLVPALVEGWWFMVIPDELDFTGILTFLNTNIERIWSVAYTATGDIFSANASFVAVGWSASGFLGVVLASVTIFGSLKIADILSSQLPTQLRLGLYFITIPAFLIMISGSVMDFCGKGGAVVFLGIAIFMFSKKHRAGAAE